MMLAVQYGLLCVIARVFLKLGFGILGGVLHLVDRYYYNHHFTKTDPHAYFMHLLISLIQWDDTNVIKSTQGG